MAHVEGVRTGIALVNTPRRQVVGDRISSPISRRRFISLSGSAATVSLLELLDACSSGAVNRTAPPRGPHLELRHFGARGNGHTDDTAAFQRALQAARPGTTVRGRPGAIYVINGTVSFPHDKVVLDLAGGAVRTGPARIGDAVTSDTLFEMNGRHGVRITHGRILTSLSPFSGGDIPAKIVITSSTGCVVSNLRAACGGSALVEIAAGSGHHVEGNQIHEGYVGGFSCKTSSYVTT